MQSVKGFSPGIYFPLLFVSLLSAALIRNLLAQQQTNPPNFMQSMDVSMTKMDAAMKAAPMNGNADHDFAVMMIPHHRGAIDMAKSELLFGKDPVMRRLAQEVLVDQQSEIDAMNLWLGRKAGRQQVEKNQ